MTCLKRSEIMHSRPLKIHKVSAEVFTTRKTLTESTKDTALKSRGRSLLTQTSAQANGKAR